MRIQLILLLLVLFRLSLSLSRMLSSAETFCRTGCGGDGSGCGCGSGSGDGCGVGGVAREGARAGNCGPGAAGGSGHLKLEKESVQEAVAGFPAALTGVLVRVGEKVDVVGVRMEATPPVAYRQAWRDRSRMEAAALAAFAFFSASCLELRKRRMLNMKQVLCKMIQKTRSSHKNFSSRAKFPFVLIKNPLLLHNLTIFIKFD